MASDLKVGIDITTKADAAPIAQVEKALEGVEQQTRETAAAMSGAGIAGGNPWITASRSATQHAQTLNDQVAPAQENVRRSSGNMGNALLQGSRALQDLQYGIGGVLNNLEGLAAALGLGAGVAGMATIAGVALVALGPKIAEITGLSEMLEDASGATAAKLQEQANAAHAELAAALDVAGIASRKFAEEQAAQQKAIDLVNESLNHQVQLLQMRDRMLKDKEQARLEAEVEDIKGKGLPPEEEARQLREAYARSTKTQREQSEAARIEGRNAAGVATAQAQQEFDKNAADKNRLEQKQIDALTYDAGLKDLAAEREKLRQAELAAIYTSTAAGVPANMQQQVDEAKKRVQELEATTGMLYAKYGTTPSFQKDEEDQLKHFREEDAKRRAALEAAQKNEREVAGRQAVEREAEGSKAEIEAGKREREIQRGLEKRQKEEADKRRNEEALKAENDARELERKNRDAEAAAKRKQAEELRLGDKLTEEQRRKLELDMQDRINKAREADEREARGRSGRGGSGGRSRNLSTGGGGGGGVFDGGDGGSGDGFVNPFESIRGSRRGLRGLVGQGGAADGPSIDDLMAAMHGGASSRNGSGPQVKRLGTAGGGAGGDVGGVQSALQGLAGSNAEGNAAVMELLTVLMAEVKRMQGDNAKLQQTASRMASQMRNSRGGG